MKKIFFVAVLFLFVSCKKSNDCNNEAGNLIGSWMLTSNQSYVTSTRTYSGWHNVAPSNRAVIKFSHDSLFNFSNNYEWKYFNFNRFTATDSVNIFIYSTDTNPGGANSLKMPFVHVKMINSNEIILTYLGVDAGTQEWYRFKCYPENP